MLSWGHFHHRVDTKLRGEGLRRKFIILAATGKLNVVSSSTNTSLLPYLLEAAHNVLCGIELDPGGGRWGMEIMVLTIIFFVILLSSSY